MNQNTKEISRPFWRDAALISAVASLLAIIIPGTAAINGVFKARTEAQKQIHDIRIKYLDRAIDPTGKPNYRKSVLEFLVVTLDTNDPMRNWAEKFLRNLTTISENREAVGKISRRISIVESQLKQIDNNKTKYAHQSELRELDNKLTDLINATSKAEKIADIPKEYSVLKPYLEIKTTPPNADILLDGTHVGKSPILLEVDSGKHEIGISLNGHYQSSAEVDVNEVGILPIFMRLIPK